MFLVWENNWCFIEDFLREKHIEIIPVEKYLIYMLNFFSFVNLYITYFFF